MFEINKYLICKMGWVQYSLHRGIGIHYQSHSTSEIMQPFADDELVRFFLTKKDQYICYIIKEFHEDEKQTVENPYKFIIMNYKPEIVSLGNPEFEIIEFGSNAELFKLIAKNQACNEVYQRYFVINNILNEEN